MRRHRQQVLARGFDRFIAKPMNTRELIDVLVELLGIAWQWPLPMANKALAQEPAESQNTGAQFLDAATLDAWPALGDAPSINQLLAFSRQLEDLGKSRQDPEVLGLAEHLRKSAQEIDIRSVGTLRDSQRTRLAVVEEGSRGQSPLLPERSIHPADNGHLNGVL